MWPPSRILKMGLQIEISYFVVAKQTVTYCYIIKNRIDQFGCPSSHLFIASSTQVAMTTADFLAAPVQVKNTASLHAAKDSYLTLSAIHTILPTWQAAWSGSASVYKHMYT